MKAKSILSGVAALAMSAASILPAVGASAVTIGSDGSGTTGSSSTIPFSREIENVSNPVNNTFTYTITADNDNPAVATGVPTSTTIVFNNVTPTSGKATASGAIDFNGATFNTLGDYYYTITETGSTDATNYPLSSQTYTAMLSVRNVLNGNVPTDDLEVTLVQLMDNGTAKESAVFTSAATRTYFQVVSNVTGNMSEKDQCFKYKVSIPVQTGVTAGDTYTLNSSALTCEGNPDTITAGEDNYIYLKHGDTATIGLDGSSSELPVGVSYTVSKEEGTDTGYTTKVDGEDGTTTTKTTVATDNANFNTLSTTTFTNDKTQQPLTGIVTNVWTWVVIIGLGAAGVAYTSRKSKHEA